ncbi:MAG: glycosyltransferase family 39 protein [Anaerolineae bacterium]|nr:glycosyltransferase family 39 protein [Anaerolineae bacterium]
MPTSQSIYLQKYRNKAAWAIVILGILIRLPLLPLPLTYGSDTWRQADTASIAHHFGVNGFKILYPQINWGGNGPGYVEAEFQLYTFIVALFYGAFGEALWLGRLVSLLFTIPTFILFYLWARRVVGTRPSLLALAFFVISPLLIRYSVAYMPEATVIFFYVAALYFFQKWMDEQHKLSLFLASVSTSLAILIKPSSIHIGLLFALLAIQQYGGALAKRRVVWLAVVVSLLPGILWYWHARNLYLEYGNTFGVLSGGDSKFGSLSYWLSPSFYLSVAELEGKWVFSGTGVLLFTIGLIVAFKRRQLLPLFGIITIGFYYFIVARYAQAEWGIQYHVYAVPFAALAMGIGCDWLLTHKRHRIGAGIAVVSIVATVAGTAYLYSLMLRAEETPLTICARWVETLVPEENRIIVSTDSLSLDQGIPNNYQDPTIFFYSHRYGWSLPADWHSPDRVEGFRQSGANYFVIYSKSLYDGSPQLAAYLESRSEQVGPGVAAGCGIYHFKH